MTVRAKFVVQKIQCSYQTKYKNDSDGRLDYKQPYNVEMRTVHMSPVYGNGDPNHENTKFWEASPSGGLTLGTINPAAWQQFELGREYYLDFAPTPTPEA
jgi:hypothetical protein